jgi:hypothetical protein
LEPAIKQQDAEIISEKDYILVVQPDGLNFWEIFLALGRLIQMSEFREKNDIWIFRKGHVDFLYADLFRLIDFIKTHCTARTKRKKTAIVVETMTQLSLAVSYANMSRNLPCKIKVFTDFRAAEEWTRRLI